MYVVKKSDTLSSIGKKYSLSYKTIAAYNKIAAPYTIRPGQKLKIPSKSAGYLAHKSMPKELGNIRPSSRWKNIVIHHSATKTGTVKGMDDYHRRVRRMENGLAYHFVIGNGKGMKDGEIAVGTRWKRQIDGGHLRSTSQNRTSIGICLVGNFDKQWPTKKQLDSLSVLVQYLMNRCRLNPASVKTHQQINVRHTRCPGKRFPTKNFIRRIKAAT